MRRGEEGRRHGIVVPFGRPTIRIKPRPDGQEAERGTLLLFTGVRYQRFAEHEPFPVFVEPSSASGDRRLGA